MTAPKEISQLVKRFDQHREAYRSSQYNETQLRREFLDPFFNVLGWDVENKQGHAEVYKDVVHEDAIKIGSFTKAPDYCFRIGGTRKFFVEAKKPSVDIRQEANPAFQLRRYAWSAKLPLSILTDFEEFAVYDCRIKPTHADKASLGRIQYLTYTEYTERWEDIAAVFSKEAVLRGSFDKFAEKSGATRGTAEVDAAFLQEIESWRDQLARHLALRNPRLTQRELNFAVQRTIDRIIFLRICEDRGIEPEAQLLGLINAPGIYGRLLELYRRADERYNSGLFHFRQEKGRAEDFDRLTPGLTIEDKILKDIFRNLYFPDSPYEFSVLPADILGQVYEQFLGKVIRLTAGHQAKVEDKPEVKKAGGVFYTPTYIVDYIVRNTVGHLLKGKTPKTAEKLTILDPACGSGSFLIGVFQLLLDWHRDWYMNNGKEKWSRGKHPVLYQGAGGEWRLTTEQRKRILTNNIYGVDIDPQAVEVTKLSLLLKVLEGESGQTLFSQFKLFQERALPDLGNNIKCGNSLICPDFYKRVCGNLPLFGELERLRINVFDWEKEFPRIFSVANPGFDVVIGNPPYIRIQALKEWAPLEVEYYKTRYASAGKGNYDIYVVFVEKGLSLLNGNGRLGYILPHKFFNAQYGEPLRDLLSKGKHLAEVIHFGDKQIFAGATTYTCLMFLSKNGSEDCRFLKVDDLLDWRIRNRETFAKSSTAVPIQKEDSVTLVQVSSSEWNFTIGKSSGIFDKLSAMPVKLGHIAHTFVGTQTSADNVFVLDNCKTNKEFTIGISSSLGKEVKVETASTYPFLRGKQIRRYEFPRTNFRLISPYSLDNDNCWLIPFSKFKRKFPYAAGYLEENKSLLSVREKGKFKGDNWYAFGYPKSMALFQKHKIIVPDYNNQPSFSYDTGGHYFKTGYGLLIKKSKMNPYFILGLLNSKLLFYYLKLIGTSLRGGYVRFWRQYIDQLPIRTLDISKSSDKSRHDHMVTLVEAMLTLHQQYVLQNTDHERTTLQRLIESTDKQIEQLVYDLYGLSVKEMQIVDNG